MIDRITTAQPQAASRTLQLLALASISGTTLFIVAYTIAQIQRSDLDAQHHFVSELLIGSAGPIMAFGFFASAIGSACVIAGLARRLPLDIVTVLGFLGLAGWSIGGFIAGAFPPTPQLNQIHVTAATAAFGGLPIAALVLSLRLLGLERWRAFARPALAWAVVVIVMVIGGWSIVSRAFGEHLIVAVDLIWMYVIAVGLLRHAD